MTRIALIASARLVGRLSRLRRFAVDRRGVSATEFALLVPVFGTILAGTADLGSSIYAQFGLNAAVSAGANYALVNGSSATSSGAATLSSSVANIVASAQGTSVVTSVVTVNNGPTSTTVNGATSRSGTASNADSCYCPTLAEATVTWGTAKTCGAACAGGGYAGKFVAIKATRQFNAIFGSLGVSQSGALSSEAVVQVQ